MTAVDAPLAGADDAAILADFRNADRCPDCRGIVLAGHTHDVPTAMPPWWVDVHTYLFPAALPTRARDLFEQYTARTEHTAFSNGHVRLHCGSQATAESTRELLLGYGLPRHLVVAMSKERV